MEVFIDTSTPELPVAGLQIRPFTKRSTSEPLPGFLVLDVLVLVLLQLNAKPLSHQEVKPKAPDRSTWLRLAGTGLQSYLWAGEKFLFPLV